MGTISWGSTCCDSALKRSCVAKPARKNRETGNKRGREHCIGSIGCRVFLEKEALNSKT